MLARKKLLISALTLLILASLAYGGIYYVGKVQLAEGYLYEDENRLLFAKVIPGEDNLQVELHEAKIDTSDKLPVIQNNSYSYSGMMDDGQLILQATGGKQITATVNQAELVFHDQTTEANVGGAKLLASPYTTYSQKLDAMKKRVSEQAAQIQKEEAEAAFAQNVEKTGKYQSYIAENAKYLSEMDFQDESQSYEQSLAELQGLLDEISSMAQKPDLSKAELTTMEIMVGSMETVLSGLEDIDQKLALKKKSMNEVMATLQSDMDETKKLWDQIKDGIPDVNSRLQAYNESMKSGTQAIQQAKEKIAKAEKLHASNKKKSAALYQKAGAIISQTKAKSKF